MKEQDIQTSILELLRYQGIFAWRQGNHSVFDTQTKRYRSKSKWEIKGVSDILGVLGDGRLLAIEVKKSSKEKPSKDQKEFIQQINSNGGMAFVAYSLECIDKNIGDYYKYEIDGSFH